MLGPGLGEKGVEGKTLALNRVFCEALFVESGLSRARVLCGCYGAKHGAVESEECNKIIEEKKNVQDFFRDTKQTANRSKSKRCYGPPGPHSTISERFIQPCQTWTPTPIIPVYRQICFGRRQKATFKDGKCDLWKRMLWVFHPTFPFLNKWKQVELLFDLRRMLLCKHEGIVGPASIEGS